MQKVLNFLQSNEIDFVLHKHIAVFTCEEVDEHCSDIQGLSCKNLFIKNRKGKRFFLIVLPASKKADVKAIGRMVGQSGLTFANAGNLKDKLDLEPGSVSPFGLINDVNSEVEVFIDKTVFEAQIVNFHPNKNTATLELTNVMFKKYLGTLNNKIEVLEL